MPSAQIHGHRLACQALARHSLCEQYALLKAAAARLCLLRLGVGRLALDDTPVTEQLANHIRMLRSERRWSARQLAEACHQQGSASLSRPTIAKIESGFRKSLKPNEVDVLAR